MEMLEKRIWWKAHLRAMGAAAAAGWGRRWEVDNMNSKFVIKNVFLSCNLIVMQLRQENAWETNQMKGPLACIGRREVGVGGRSMTWAGLGRAEAISMGFTNIQLLSDGCDCNRLLARPLSLIVIRQKNSWRMIRIGHGKYPADSIWIGSRQGN